MQDVHPDSIRRILCRDSPKYGEHLLTLERFQWRYTKEDKKWLRHEIKSLMLARSKHTATGPTMMPPADNIFTHYTIPWDMLADADTMKRLRCVKAEMVRRRKRATKLSDLLARQHGSDSKKNKWKKPRAPRVVYDDGSNYYDPETMPLDQRTLMIHPPADLAKANEPPAKMREHFAPRGRTDSMEKQLRDLHCKKHPGLLAKRRGLCGKCMEKEDIARELGTMFTGMPMDRQQQQQQSHYIDWTDR